MLRKQQQYLLYLHSPLDQTQQEGGVTVATCQTHFHTQELPLLP